MKFSILIAICYIALIEQSNCFDWSNGDWAMDCDFPGKDLSSVQIAGEFCFQTCIATAGCTHFTWTNHNGGTCWMKTGNRCKSEAQWNQGAVCGVVAGSCGSGDPDNILGGGDLNGGDGSTINYGDLIWADEFDYNGPPREDLWYQETDGGHGWGNNELQYYTKDHNSKVGDGNLVVESRLENYGHLRYTSGRMVSQKHFRYGIFEMRAKLPQGRGIWSAFWMLASKRPLNWPTDGEIDIMEHVGFDPTRVHATVHTGKFNHMIGTQVGRSYKLTNPFDDFHTYTVNWTPNYIKAYIDGNHYFTYEKTDTSFGVWPFDTDFQILLNVAVGGNWGGAQGVDDSIFPTQYTVDYVRQYQNGFVKV